MNNTKQNSDRLAKLALVCLLLGSVSGCKSLAYYVGANSQSTSLDQKRDWATRSHAAAYNQAPYFHCCHCGEVVAWGTKHDCAPTIAPPFFGHQGTCWRPWPKEWVACPEQLISEEIQPIMPTPPADPMPSGHGRLLPTTPAEHNAQMRVPLDHAPMNRTQHSPVSSVRLPPQDMAQGVLNQRVAPQPSAPVSQPGHSPTGPLEPAPHDASKAPTLAAGVPTPAPSESLQSVLRLESGDRVASRQKLDNRPVLSAPAAAPEPSEPEAVKTKSEPVKVKTQKPEANPNNSAPVSTPVEPSPVVPSPVVPSPVAPLSIEPEIAQSQAKPTLAKPVAVKPTVVKSTVAKPTVAKAAKSKPVAPKSIAAKSVAAKPVAAKSVEVKPTKEPKSEVVLSEPKSPAVKNAVKQVAKNVTQDKAKTTTKIVRAEPKPLPQGAAEIRFRSVSDVRFSEARVRESEKESTVRTARFETSGTTKSHDKSVKKSSLNSRVKRTLKPSKKQTSSQPTVAPTKSETTKTPQASPRSRLQPVRIQSLDH